MKTTLSLVFVLVYFACLTTLSYSQEHKHTPKPQLRVLPKCAHLDLEKIISWVPSKYRPQFSNFLFFQNLDNSGFNYCTLAQAKKRLAQLQKEPSKHEEELKHHLIWLEVLELWIQEEEEHWKKTLPKFLPPKEVTEVFKKLKSWKEHCHQCVQRLTPKHRRQCFSKGFLHRHPIPRKKKL